MSVIASCHPLLVIEHCGRMCMLLTLGKRCYCMALLCADVPMPQVVCRPDSQRAICCVLTAFAPGKQGCSLLSSLDHGIPCLVAYIAQNISSLQQTVSAAVCTKWQCMAATCSPTTWAGMPEFPVAADESYSRATWVDMRENGLILKIELARHNTALNVLCMPHLEWSQALSEGPGQSSQET